MDTRYINKTYFISADDEGDDAITAEEANKLKYRLATSLNLKHFLELGNE